MGPFWLFVLYDRQHCLLCIFLCQIMMKRWELGDPCHLKSTDVVGDAPCGIPVNIDIKGRLCSSLCLMFRPLETSSLHLYSVRIVIKEPNALFFTLCCLGCRALTTVFRSKAIHGTTSTRHAKAPTTSAHWRTKLWYCLCCSLA